MMIHTMLYSKEDGLWTVGFYEPVVPNSTLNAPRWHALEDFNIKEDAAAFVNFLNGGSGRQEV